MKTKNLIAVILMALIMSIGLPSFTQDSFVEPFLGAWALTLDFESGNAGWLEVRQEDGYLDSDLLWRGGSVNPIAFTAVQNGMLVLVNGQDVIRKRDEQQNPVRTTHPVNWYQVTSIGDNNLEGWAYFPNNNGIGVRTVSFIGKKIPPPGKAPDMKKIKYGAPANLFNGKDFQGWELTDLNATNGWKVVDGTMMNDPVQNSGETHIRYGNLRTSDTYEDFNLKLEVNIPAGSNSGVYLRGIYEVQVVDSYGRELDSHNMGGLYSRITPLVAAEKPAGEWQEMDMTLYKRHLTVLLNGKMIIKNQPVKGVTGGALTSDEFSPGPIYLQGDHGKVSYRNMVLTPIEK